MKPSPSPLLRAALACAVLGFAVGLFTAVRDLASAAQVLEFQAEDADVGGQRWVAIAQRAALDGLGFGLLGLMLAGVARAVGPRASSAGTFLLCASAAAVWIGPGTWLGEAALPFLGARGIVLLDLAGFAACLGVLLALHAVVRRLPWASADAPLGTALASAALFAAVSFWARGAVLVPHTPGRLALGAAVGLVALLAAPLLGRGLEPLARTAGRLLDARGARLAGRGLGAGLAACALAALLTLELSAVSAELEPREQTSTAPQGPNVVLVTVDTLRADHLGCYGYPRDTSPFLDELAAAGTRFDDPIASAAWTKPATGTILTGLYPSRHGALYHGSSLRTPEGGRTLAEAFQDAGFATAGFVTNPNIKRVFDFDRGFEEYFDSPVEDTVTLAAVRGSLFGQVLMRLARHQFNWKYENDVRQMNRHIEPWLRRNADERFFLYLHYIDPHIPYTPPEPYRSEFLQDHGLALFQERKEKVGRDLYDGEIRYADEGLREIVGVMRELGIWENTVFAFTSDHGEEFFEHGVLGHGFSLYQPVVRVPLVLHGPGVAAGRVVEEPAQIVDLPATLLDAAGLGVVELGDGRSFAEALRPGGGAQTWDAPSLYFLENEFGQGHDDNRSFVFNGVREGPWKLVLTEANRFFPPGEFGAQALYDLESDPEERVNLVDDPAQRERVQRMLDALREHAAFLEGQGFRDLAPATLSPEMEESLRALGYL